MQMNYYGILEEIKPDKEKALSFLKNHLILQKIVDIFILPEKIIFIYTTAENIYIKIIK